MDWDKFNNLKILVVDDDQLTRELIRTLLKKVPTVTVYQSSDGLEALAMIQENKFDMLLLDLYMPRMSGAEFIKTLKKNNQFKSFPIVLMSTDRLNREELKNIGAKYYLTKPFDFHNFLNDIYDFLEQEISA
ncbi:MAG: Unknown protein [uncultured Sulfurovum sp.]|uniref:Response regulatory domain-containing protein n=1 Tax=uncultured Sulfurovum sp. TaxID=269237 RepID=A0A6S6S8C5_9BACT|nr:MAG: Unknown protein [uncultured Sulfurovum sp.]